MKDKTKKKVVSKQVSKRKKDKSKKLFLKKIRDLIEKMDGYPKTFIMRKDNYGGHLIYLYVFITNDNGEYEPVIALPPINIDNNEVLYDLKEIIYYFSELAPIKYPSPTLIEYPLDNTSEYIEITNEANDRLILCSYKLNKEAEAYAINDFDYYSDDSMEQYMDSLKCIIKLLIKYSNYHQYLYRLLKNNQTKKIALIPGGKVKKLK
jgi:hypothetical protein